jgi:hypothetical protein
VAPSGRGALGPDTRWVKEQRTHLTHDEACDIRGVLALLPRAEYDARQPGCVVADILAVLADGQIPPAHSLDERGAHPGLPTPLITEE